MDHPQIYSEDITLISKPEKKNNEKYKIIGQYFDIDAKSSIKYQQTKFNSTSKGSYTMIKCDLAYGCKEVSIFTNQCDTPG